MDKVSEELNVYGVFFEEELVFGIFIVSCLFEKDDWLDLDFKLLNINDLFGGMDLVFGIFIVWLMFEVDFILFILEVLFGDIEIVYEEFKFCVMFFWVYLIFGIFFVSCLFEKGDMVLVVLNLYDLFWG